MSTISPTVTRVGLMAAAAALEKFCGPDEVSNDQSIVGFGWSEEALVAVTAYLAADPFLAALLDVAEHAPHFVAAADQRVVQLAGHDDQYFDAYHDARYPLVVALGDLNRVIGSANPQKLEDK